MPQTWANGRTDRLACCCAANKGMCTPSTCPMNELEREIEADRESYKMNPSFNVKTWWDADGTITQEVFSKVDDVTRTISRQVLATQETQIRDALIALGWTPPQFDHQKPKD